MGHGFHELSAPAPIGNVVRQTCCSDALGFVQYVEVLQDGKLPDQHCEGVAGFGGGLKFLSKSRQCLGAVGGNKCAACDTRPSKDGGHVWECQLVQLG